MKSIYKCTICNALRRVEDSEDVVMVFCLSCQSVMKPKKEVEEGTTD